QRRSLGQFHRAVEDRHVSVISIERDRQFHSTNSTMFAVDTKAFSGTAGFRFPEKSATTQETWRRGECNMRTRLSRLAALVLAALTIAAGRANADDVADFYKGRTINYFLATTPGGSWDVYLRVLINHWAKRIPGNPAIVVQYQPGGGGVKTLEYMDAIAPKDGTAIATPLPTSLVYSALN